ncbi:hypothetical protein C8Q76DRAFT_34801 [Earliella scabrosa]|nr:hypothetical protein C8Q76DRAFT_34801 [Earliella scabrosa]
MTSCCPHVLSFFLVLPPVSSRLDSRRLLPSAHVFHPPSTPRLRSRPNSTTLYLASDVPSFPGHTHITDVYLFPSSIVALAALTSLDILLSLPIPAHYPLPPRPLPNPASHLF